MSADNKKELEYLLKFSFYYICDFIDNVLEDSEDDPEYSAVTLCNLIYCYQRIKSPGITGAKGAAVKDFFIERFGSDEEYKIIEQKRLIEKEHYVGEQFID